MKQARLVELQEAKRTTYIRCFKTVIFIGIKDWDSRTSLTNHRADLEIVVPNNLGVSFAIFDFEFFWPEKAICESDKLSNIKKDRKICLWHIKNVSFFRCKDIKELKIYEIKSKYNKLKIELYKS